MCFLCLWWRSWVIQLVTTDIEDSIEAGAVVFKRELRAKLEQLLRGEFLSQARVEIVGHVRRRVCHLVGEFNHQTLHVREYREIILDNRQ